jgi:uncharacterized protein
MQNYVLKFRGKNLHFSFPVASVATECLYDEPVTLIQTQTLGSQAFTRTPYWLHCPRLVRKIRDLESRGWIKILQDFVQGPLKKEWEEFTAQVPSLLKTTLEPKFFDTLRAEGRTHIGGVKNPIYLKCLHAHFAFFLVHQFGFVGRFVHGLLTWTAKRENTPDSAYFCEPHLLECQRSQP